MADHDLALRQIQVVMSEKINTITFYIKLVSVICTFKYPNQ